MTISIRSLTPGKAALLRTRSVLIVVTILLGIGAATWGRKQWRIAVIANRNIDRVVCSCLFISRMSLDGCIADVPRPERLHLDFVRFAVDSTPGAEALTTTMFGVISSTANYHQGTGCTQD